jgi:uncharacterized OB-fold protein
MASLPLPIPNEDTQAFWDYCKAGELRAQRCTACGTLRHPPRPTCAECGSFDYEWVKLSGKGTIYTFSVSQQAIHNALEGLIPHTAILVQLEEGPLFTSNLVEGDDRVAIGLPVEVVFEPVNDEITLPKFRLV